jgi:DNA-binding MarR family transcriptional regulator
MVRMSSDSPWLTDEQQRVWRGWLAMNTRLPAALQGQLQEDAGLSLQDFEVLVHLTETVDGRMRVTDLAGTMGWERSRLSHHIKRMEGRDLVQRAGCPDDGRGAFVVLTPTGRAAIDGVAPGHARTVRRLVFDALTEEELAALGALTEKVLGRLEGDGSPAAGQPAERSLQKSTRQPVGNHEVV